MKTAEETISERAYYIRPAKTIHKVFLLAKFENFIKEWAGGYYLVMKSTPIVPGDIPFVSIIYKYNDCTVLVSIATWGGLEVLN